MLWFLLKAYYSYPSFCLPFFFYLESFLSPDISTLLVTSFLSFLSSMNVYGSNSDCGVCITSALTYWPFQWASFKHVYHTLKSWPSTSDKCHLSFVFSWWLSFIQFEMGFVMRLVLVVSLTQCRFTCGECLQKEVVYIIGLWTCLWQVILITLIDVGKTQPKKDGSISEIWVINCLRVGKESWVENMALFVLSALDYRCDQLLKTLAPVTFLPWWSITQNCELK